eukprot:symbB.v1.2.030326.t1/scaffold3400.1/size59204/2
MITTLSPFREPVWLHVLAGPDTLRRDPQRGFARLVESGKENLEWQLLEHDSVEAFLTWLRGSQHAAPPMVFGTIWGYEEELRQSAATVGGANWPELFANEPWEQLRRWTRPVVFAEGSLVRRSDLPHARLDPSWHTGSVGSEDNHRRWQKLSAKDLSKSCLHPEARTDDLVGDAEGIFDLRSGEKELNDLAESQEAALANVTVPDDFLDPIMSEIMVDPVLLPTSNTVMDRKVIERHIMSNDDDPFNRQSLSVKDLVPQTELKEKITEFCKKHGIVMGNESSND